MVKAYAFAADGTEEGELLCVVDILRRAAVDVEIVSVCGATFTSSHGVKIQADALVSDGKFDDAELVFLPGGMPGSRVLGENKRLVEIIDGQLKRGKRVAAICAAPAEVLGKNGFLRGKKATCYPGFEGDHGCTYTGERVVTDGLVSTGIGLGAAIELGLELVKLLCGDAAAENVKEKIKN